MAILLWFRGFRLLLELMLLVIRGCVLLGFILLGLRVYNACN